ncbi:FAD-binding oxidoreductase [Acidilobus saccharovorans]|uniref:FAD-binding oxidoreductase n=1 Tax=Acidilobus saccharovorans TaxID=242703 RepID=UPI001EE56D33|nr:FAD-linked oxidase C-terminal domain-containing protein [Acidilobus saccharovorans]
MQRLEDKVGEAVRLLRDELGDDKVITDPNVVMLYSREPDGLAHQANAVVFPSTPDEVSRVVATSYSYEVPIYPQGSSSSLSGNAVPLKGGLVLSLERMSSILDVSLADSVADVEPGVRIDDLNVELSKVGYMFPVDPASQAVATVGGAINNGAGGMRGAKYGTMRDWVNGLEVVLADESGTRLWLGCRTVKCREGYDLVRLIVGSEGTLAVVTRAALRIAPLPEKVVTALAFFDDIGSLMKAYMAIKTSRVQPYIAEFMDAPTVRLASQAVSLPFEASSNMFLVSLESTPESSERHLRWLEGVMRSSGARNVYTADNDKDAEPLYQLRRSLFPAQVNMFRRPGRPFQLLIEDIVVPPSRVPEAIRELRALDDKYGLTSSLGGHIGDGNLHPAIGFDPTDPESTKVALQWFDDVVDIALRLGGAVSAEHGIGVIKREALRRAVGDRQLELMRSIKAAFDPRGILNPGKLF